MEQYNQQVAEEKKKKQRDYMSLCQRVKRNRVKVGEATSLQQAQRIAMGRIDVRFLPLWNSEVIQIWVGRE